jgi:hypothetical protein
MPTLTRWAAPASASEVAEVLSLGHCAPPVVVGRQCSATRGSPVGNEASPCRRRSATDQAARGCAPRQRTCPRTSVPERAARWTRTRGESAGRRCRTDWRKAASQAAALRGSARISGSPVSSQTQGHRPGESVVVSSTGPMSVDRAQIRWHERCVNQPACPAGQAERSSPRHLEGLGRGQGIPRPETARSAWRDVVASRLPTHRREPSKRPASRPDSG